MSIIDGQIHAWGAETAEEPWVPGMRSRVHREEPLHTEYLLEVMDAAGVDAAVLVPPSLWVGFTNDYSLRAAAEHPDRFAVMGVLDFCEDGAEQEVSTWPGIPGMKGARLSFYNEPQRSQLLEGKAEWLWQRLQDLGLPVMVNAPGLLREMGEIAQKYPGLRLCIDHLGLHANDKDQPLMPRLEPLLALAEYPNVTVKASALPLQSHEDFPFADVAEAVPAVLESFGADRVFWGTDWSRLSCSYREALDSFQVALQPLGAEIVAKVMGASVAAWLDWSNVRGSGDAPAAAEGRN